MVKESFDINRDKLVAKLLAGLLLGGGVSAAASTIRDFRKMKSKDDGTDDESIVLTLPKAAESAYDSFKDMRSGTSRYCSTDRPRDEKGRFVAEPVKCDGKCDSEECPETKEAQDSTDSTVADKVVGTLGLVGSALIGYEMTNTLYDKWQERKLKRQLEAAREAYVSGLMGNSKRAEAVDRVLSSAEAYVCHLDKVASNSAGSPTITDLASKAPGAGAVSNAAAVVAILALLGTGGTAYITKKLLDKEFPDDKLKSTPDRPTRIVFRTDKRGPSVMSGAEGEEKVASDLECAGLLAAMPIYMDVVEGSPSRTLSRPYVKFAEANGTDPAGLMKMAMSNFGNLMVQLLRNPKALLDILLSSGFGFADNVKGNVAHAMTAYPGVFNALVRSQLPADLSQEDMARLGPLVDKATATPELRRSIAYAAGDSKFPGISDRAGLKSYLYGNKAIELEPMRQFYADNLSNTAIAKRIASDTAAEAQAKLTEAAAAAKKAVGRRFGFILGSGTKATPAGSSQTQPAAVPPAPPAQTGGQP